jgi:hypothetical protein
MASNAPTLRKPSKRFNAGSSRVEIGKFIIKLNRYF